MAAREVLWELPGLEERWGLSCLVRPLVLEVAEVALLHGVEQLDEAEHTDEAESQDDRRLLPSRDHLCPNRKLRLAELRCILPGKQPGCENKRRWLRRQRPKRLFSTRIVRLLVSSSCSGVLAILAVIRYIMHRIYVCERDTQSQYCQDCTSCFLLILLHHLHTAIAIAVKALCQVGRVLISDRVDKVLLDGSHSNESGEDVLRTGLVVCT